MANSALTQQALVNDSRFRARFNALLLQMCAQILNTPLGTGNPVVTAGQQTYARNIMAGTQQTQGLILYFAFRTNIFGSNVTCDIAEGFPVVSTDASDAAILSQLANDWPTISGA